jgi:O-methyltransferase
MFRSRVKSFLLNSTVPDRLQLGHLVDFNRFGTWIRKSSASVKPHLPERRALYRFVCETCFPQEPIDFLEFGVYKGESIREWAALNQYENSRFFGFDCFQGLPEDWNLRRGTLAMGTFDTGGKIPDVQDCRISFVKGLFQESLPGFLEHFERRNRLVIHMDADLYTSTLYVLTRLHEFMVPGTFVFFDEFITEEFRAWDDFATSHMREYSVVATSGQLPDKVCLIVDK